MSETLIVAIISSVAAIAAAIIGGLVTNPTFFKDLFASKKLKRFIGNWDCEYKDFKVADEVRHELLKFEKIKGAKIYGRILSESYSGRDCELEGYFNGRFLQINYHPSDHSESLLIEDFGCYFLEVMSNGVLKGYAIGYYFEVSETIVWETTIKKIR